MEGREREGRGMIRLFLGFINNWSESVGLIGIKGIFEGYVCVGKFQSSFMQRGERPINNSHSFGIRRKRRFGPSFHAAIRYLAHQTTYPLANSPSSLKTLFENPKFLFSSSTKIFPLRIEPASPRPLSSPQVLPASFRVQICKLVVRRFFMSAPKNK
jgi:hypothetical protein